MPQRRSTTVNDLLRLLGSGAPVPAGQLLQALGVSRPVLGRLVAEAGEQVLRIGKARATCYAARSRIDSESLWPLWRMRGDGTLEELGALLLLRGERFQFEPSGERPNLTRPVEEIPGHFPGLPWFLDDVRPQGFLGRTLAHRQAARLGVPADLNRWVLRDIMLAISRSGGTSIGDLLLGASAVDQARAQRIQPSDAIPASKRSRLYAQWAQEALAGEEVGSSPGGEQPKFTASVYSDSERYAALVKFAVPDGGQAARRWADLLVCESLALRCLREAGLPASDATIIESQGHTCLEVRRFDRTPNSLGRLGFVSLAALGAAFVGSAVADWSQAGEQLSAQRWITRDTANQIARLHWFGRLMGNGDMHPGNLGFLLGDAGPLALAPAYDMLPMSLAPSNTGAVRAAAPLQLSAPERAGQVPHIAWAAEVAQRFWQDVADCEAIQSEELRALARTNRRAVAEYAASFARR